MDLLGITFKLDEGVESIGEMREAIEKFPEMVISEARRKKYLKVSRDPKDKSIIVMKLLKDGSISLPKINEGLSHYKNGNYSHILINYKGTEYKIIRL